MVKIIYKTGDKVFAKVKGYPPWPARKHYSEDGNLVYGTTRTAEEEGYVENVLKVVGDTGKKKYNVLFYGTQETGAIKPEDLSYYLKYKESYVHKYIKRVGYEDAVKQIEEAIKKDGGDGNDGASADDSHHDVDASDASSVSSVSEKKAPKRKVASLPADDSVAKKSPAKGRRRSVALAESKEDNSEEPAPKRPRRKSTASTESKEEEEAAPEPEKSKKSSDNGVKEVTAKEARDEAEEEEEEDVVKVKQEPVKTEKETETSLDETTASASESEKIEDEKIEETKKPKESEFVEIKTPAYETMEEEPSEDTDKSVTEKWTGKIEIVTEQTLNHNILYAEHVKKDADSYKDKPVEPRQDSKDDVFAVKLPSEKICGVKLHKEWPLTFSNELDRTLYDEKVAKLALEAKDLLSSGKKKSHELELDVIPDIHMTLEDLKEISYARDIESKRKRLDKLNKEADLVTWDSKIKNNLGLDKAFPEAALEVMKEFSKFEKDLDLLILKKHPHILDMVRRLRKYVGNVKEWGLQGKELEDFGQQAEKIRSEAEKIYNKIKNTIKIEEEKGTYWDSFMDLAFKFRTKCKDLKESEMLVLCAEPDSRQAFLDRLDEVTESEGGTSLNPSNTSEPVLNESSVQGWPEKK